MTAMTIGKVAAKAGVNTETLRYYERRGLLPGPPRSNANYRQYPADTVPRVRFIKQAQALGFTLDEIDTLLSLNKQSSHCCDDVHEQAQQKIDSIDAKLDALLAMRQAIAVLISECDNTQPGDPCPIITSLSGDELAPID